ncbi:MAG: MFS transporter [Tenericutes bacterium]|nr:MFS transporter [Mycoplasmatota bacterium]
MNSETKSYKRNIVLDYFHSFFRNTNFTHGIWAAFLLVKGFTLIDVGIFETIFHISSITMEVPTGVIGDLYGRRTSRLLGIVVYFIYIAIMLFSTNYILMIIAFIFCGISYTFESGSSDALVYDSLKEIKEEHKFMKVNGIREVIMQFAGVLVLFLTGFFLEGLHKTDFYLTAGMFVIAFITIFMMKETHIPHNTEKLSFKDRINEHFVKTWKVVSSNKRLFLLILFGALVMAPVTCVFIYAQEYFIFNGFRESWMLYFLALHALTAGVGGLLAERMEKKFGERKLMLFLPIILSLCFFAILLPNYGYIGFILIGFIDSIFYIVLVEYINRLIPSDTRASVLSFFGMAFSFIMILIFPIMGIIGEGFSIWYSYLYVAVLVAIISIVLIVLLQKNYFLTVEVKDI